MLFTLQLQADTMSSARRKGEKQFKNRFDSHFCISLPACGESLFSNGLFVSLKQRIPGGSFTKTFARPGVGTLYERRSDSAFSGRDMLKLLQFLRPPGCATYNLQLTAHFTASGISGQIFIEGNFGLFTF